MVTIMITEFWKLLVLTLLVLLTMNCNINNKQANINSRDKIIDKNWTFYENGILNTIYLSSDNNLGELKLGAPINNKTPFMYNFVGDGELVFDYNVKTNDAQSSNEGFQVVRTSSEPLSKILYDYHFNNDTLVLSTIVNSNTVDYKLVEEKSINPIYEVRSDFIHPILNVNLPVSEKSDSYNIIGKNVIQIYVGKVKDYFSDVYGNELYFGDKQNLDGQISGNLPSLSLNIEKQKIDISSEGINVDKTILVIDRDVNMNTISKIIKMFKYHEDMSIFIRVQNLKDEASYLLLNDYDISGSELSIQSWINSIK